MNMEKVAKVMLDYKDSHSLFVEGYVYKSNKITSFLDTTHLKFSI